MVCLVRCALCDCLFTDTCVESDVCDACAHEQMEQMEVQRLVIKIDLTKKEEES